MDTIDKVINYMETQQRPNGEEPESMKGPWRMYAAVDTLRSTNIYYYCQFWASLKEFQRSKLTRSSALPKTDDGEEEGLQITIVSNEDSGNPSI